MGQNNRHLGKLAAQVVFCPPLGQCRYLPTKRGRAGYFCKNWGQCRFQRRKKSSIGNKSTFLGQCRYSSGQCRTFVGRMGTVSSQGGSVGPMAPFWGRPGGLIWIDRQDLMREGHIEAQTLRGGTHTERRGTAGIHLLLRQHGQNRQQSQTK